MAVSDCATRPSPRRTAARVASLLLTLGPVVRLADRRHGCDRFFCRRRGAGSGKAALPAGSGAGPGPPMVAQFTTSLQATRRALLVNLVRSLRAGPVADRRGTALLFLAVNAMSSAVDCRTWSGCDTGARAILPRWREASADAGCSDRRLLAIPFVNLLAPLWGRRRDHLIHRKTRIITRLARRYDLAPAVLLAACNAVPPGGSPAPPRAAVQGVPPTRPGPPRDRVPCARDSARARARRRDRTGCVRWCASSGNRGSTCAKGHRKLQVSGRLRARRIFYPGRAERNRSRRT